MALDKYVGEDFEIVYADPAWTMWGDPNKNAAAGKHYDLMSEADILAMPIRDIMADKAALFLWATTPRLDLAMQAIQSWGLHYRGMPFVWVKTRKDGKPIGAQGIPPTAVKPVVEVVLLATTHKRGRPFPLLDSTIRQVVFEPRGKHSEKPEEVRTRIDKIYGSDRKKIELFARKKTDGWECSGYEVDGDKY